MSKEAYMAIKKKRGALTAIGILVILGVTAVVSIQNMGQIASIDRSQSVPPTDARHPRWAAARMPASANRLEAHEIRKSEGLINTEIVALDGEVATGQPFRLKALARIRANVSELHYKWTLPEGVRLRSGSAEGMISNVGNGETREFEIELESLTPDSQRILFRAWRMRNGESQGNTATYITAGEIRSLETNSLQKLSAPKNPAPVAPRSPEEFRRRHIQ